MWNITLSDGTKISDLELNGTNFVSKVKIDESIFKSNLDTVTISDGEQEMQYNDLIFIQQQEWEDGYYIAFAQKTAADVTDELMIDMDYRLTLLELGLTE